MWRSKFVNSSQRGNKNIKRMRKKEKVQPVRDKIIVNFSHVQDIFFLVGNSGVCCFFLSLSLTLDFWSLMSIEKWVEINEIMAFYIPPCACMHAHHPLLHISSHKTAHIYHWRWDKWVPLDNLSIQSKREGKKLSIAISSHDITQ